MPRAGILLIPLVLGSLKAAAGDEAFFEKRIRPLLVKKCYDCHSGTKAQGGLLLDSADGWRKGGDSGPAIVPGKPESSLLLQAVKYQSLEMPPRENGGPLTSEQIADLTKWIADGAFDPRGKPVVTGRMSHEDAATWWAFQPLPELSSEVTPNHIDRVLDARIETAGLKPTDLADKRTLLRRATYDLTGLPPTRTEVAAFEADDSEDAFGRVVHRLLESPEYGVKYGRHWLDVARYADTAGENTDRPLPHAWRYRNWVLEAFNRDMPFDEFVRLQICGDLSRANAAPEARDEGLVATGYLAIARRFGHDIDHSLPLMYEDVIDNLGKAFLGLTISCARCHDHKYDPISQSDYYALFGIVDSTKYSFPGCEPRPLPANLVQLKAAPGSHPVAYAAFEGKPQDTRIQLGGDAARLGATAPRRWLEVFGGQKLIRPEESGRRELAEWIADSPLTARVIVNRVWQWHFGRGLVTTPNDFGARGDRPTHPEVLDMLAAYFRANGSRLKPLHRLIMRTNAYRRAVRLDQGSDPNNQLLAGFSRRRLTAEEIRDSLLLVSGQLDLSPGGPHPFPAETTWKFTQHEPFHAVYDTNRRSAYLMVQRQRRHPYLALFDGADPNASTSVRGTTTTPTQALYFLNSEFFHRQAAALAGLVKAEPSDQRVDFVYGQLFQRNPSLREERVVTRLLEEYPGTEAQKWAAVARVLLASNQFIFIE